MIIWHLPLFRFVFVHVYLCKNPGSTCFQPKIYRRYRRELVSKRREKWEAKNIRVELSLIWQKRLKFEIQVEFPFVKWF